MKSCRDAAITTPTIKFIKKRLTWSQPEEISTPRIVEHQTMRSNVLAESPKNYNLATSTTNFWTEGFCS